jgi:hypothetical protein
MDRPNLPAADRDGVAPIRSLRSTARPTVAWTECLGGLRVSTVVRPDGSAFTVRVPIDRVDEVDEVDGADGSQSGRTGHAGFERSWIVDHGRPRPPSNASLYRLARAVAGV